MFTKIPYPENPADLFARLQHLNRAVWLDSSRAVQSSTVPSSGARYDIMAADPLISIAGDGARLSVAGPTGARQLQGDNLRLLEQLLQPYRIQTDSALPFYGGFIGYLSYDYGRCLEPRPQLTQKDIPLPLLSGGLYLWAIVLDHQERQGWLVFDQRVTREVRQRITRLSQGQGGIPADAPQFRLKAPFESNLDYPQYCKRFLRIQDYIQAGDCYQVNFAQRFSAPCEGSPWQAYRSLRNTTSAPWSAYLGLPEGAILSFSPEQFLRVANGQAVTRPIKGTRPRLQDPEADRNIQESLKNSAKDLAENLMIVDLLRNDLGKNALTGSVQTGPLFKLQSFPNVHHLESTISARLKPGVSAIKVLRDAFPGGSITGAPKVRAMEIIEEMEPHQRAAYCGSIFYLSNHGPMDSNIAIRTLVQTDNTIHCWGGGGIVADSDCRAEYEESLVKVRHLMSGLESLP